ncbi:MAG: hypothetical protein ABSG16_02970 [Candidatus Acidiferrum sp.]
MSLAYDIFERLPDGQPLWVQAVGTIEEARAQIATLGRIRQRSARDFFVYDVRRGAEVTISEV